MNNILTYELIKKFYEKGYYSKSQLKELHKANAITEAQYFELTGEAYWNES